MSSSNVSPKKLAANRRNAQRSTGPRTIDGKSAVRFNAVKHGILSKHLVIRCSNGEDPAEFDALLIDLVQEYQPVGRQEMLLVEQIADSYFRLARVRRYESAEIQRQLAEVETANVASQADAVEMAKQFLPAESARLDLLKSSFGVQHLLGVLDKLEAAVASGRAVSSKMAADMSAYFGAESPIALALSNGAPTGQCASGTTAAEVIHELIDSERERLHNLSSALKKQESEVASAAVGRAYMPSPESATTIMRYEAMLNRNIYKAMNQLDRFQRQRRGEFVPPPIRLEVS